MQKLPDDLKPLFGRLKPLFIEAGSKLVFDPWLLAAIAWRESHFGALLDARGCGDHGHGYGVMQVDSRSHMLVGNPDSIEHVMQAANTLNDMRNGVARLFPDWSKSDRLRAAVAAYNFGLHNVKSIEHIDVGTTNNDYSADVLAKAEILRGYF